MVNNDFYARAARIQKARSSGYAFEAPGTLGNTRIYRPRKRRISVLLGPVILLLLCGTIFKAAVLIKIGQGSYDRHLVEIAGSNSTPERVIGALLYADPATRWTAAQMNKFLY